MQQSRTRVGLKGRCASGQRGLGRSLAVAVTKITTVRNVVVTLGPVTSPPAQLLLAYFPQRSTQQQNMSTPAHTEAELKALKVQDLKDLLTERRLPTSGKKDELIARLLDATVRFSPFLSTRTLSPPYRKLTAVLRLPLVERRSC